MLITKLKIVKSLPVLQFFVIASIVFAHPAYANENVSDKLNVAQQATYGALQQDASNLFIVWSDVYNIPRWIKMTDVRLPTSSDDLAGQAYLFLEQYKSLYKMSDPRTEFVVTNVEKDELGMTRVILQQQYQDIDVYAARLQFHFTAGNKLVSVHGSYIPNISLDKFPLISRTKAKQLAKENIQKSLQLDDQQLNDLDIQTGSESILIYNAGLFSDQVADSQFVWRLSTYTDKANVSRLYYINAADGSIVKQLDNSPAAEQRETYVLSDCWDSVGTLTYDETGLVGTYDDQAETIDVYSNQVYDYYYANFGRDSYDGGGAILESYANYSLQGDYYPNCVDYNNAAWEADLRIMRYAEDYLSLDVAAHEITHGVVQYVVGSTPSDTLEYENESGALNESYADIFGELVEFDSGGGDWLHGTDLPDGPNRDFADPNRSAYDETQPYDVATNYGQPSHVNEKADTADPICDSLADDDHGCIHLNSGIINNALYLLVNGGTNPYSGDGVSVGIGREAAEQIYYRALTTYLDTASDFSDAYQATMESCLDLYTTDSVTYPLSYCESIFDAFAAVGINTDTSYAWANISASASGGATPLTITFDGADSTTINSTIATYAWDFGDGTTDTGGTVSHTFTTPGTYTVTLTITDSVGTTSTDTYPIVMYYSGTLTGETTWDAAHSPYVVLDLVIPSGVTLTIDPDVVVKFYNTSAYLDISGTLLAEGTAAAPIIFTSYYDDTVAGDTNNDDSATTPAPGDWLYIRTTGSTAQATLDYVTLQYGGSDTAATSMVLIDDNTGNVTIDHSTFQESDYYTVQIDTGSTVMLSNSTMSNSTSHSAVLLSSDTATLTGNTMTAPHSAAVYITVAAASTLTQNTLTGSSYGVVLYDAATPTLTDNTITDNQFGIYTTDGAQPTVTHNLLSGNSYYALYNADPTVTITAENNWWGDTSGPYNATTNPSGLGDTVGSYIDFDPWLASSDYTAPSDATLGAIRKGVWAQTLTVNWTNPTDTDFDHIQIDRTDVAAGTTTTLSSAETGTSYADTTPSYNRTYTYTLYACDTSSNCSTGVTTTNQRLRNPAPTNLVLTPGDTTITATWTASSAPAVTVAGYNVYYGTSPGALSTVVDVGNVTTTTLTGLTNGTRYYVAVTAYSRTGVESPRSTIRATRPRP